MKWIVQDTDLSYKQVEKVLTSLKNNDIPFIPVGVIPFSHEIKSSERITGVDYIPYGSTSLTKIAEDKKWRGLFYNRDIFRYDVFIHHLKENMLNHDAIITKFGKIKEYVMSREDGKYFSKPIHDLKVYPGDCFSTCEVLEWLDRVDTNASNFENTDVIVSSVKKIYREWRHFVVKNEIISSSLYRKDGILFLKQEFDKDILKIATRLIEKWIPHETCVMDIALTDNGYQIIEFNNFNTSGFYDHDIDKVFKTVNYYYR